MVGPVHGRTKEKELEKMSMLALNRKKDKAGDMREKKKTVMGAKSLKKPE